MDTVELEIAMIKGSYEICRQARRLGYLDDNLDLTGKKPEKVVSSGTRGQGQMGGYIRGFQAGLVFNKQDIAREVEFLRNWENPAIVDLVDDLKRERYYP